MGNTELKVTLPFRTFLGWRDGSVFSKVWLLSDSGTHSPSPLLSPHISKAQGFHKGVSRWFWWYQPTCFKHGNCCTHGAYWKWLRRCSVGRMSLAQAWGPWIWMPRSHVEAGHTKITNTDWSYSLAKPRSSSFSGKHTQIRWGHCWVGKAGKEEASWKMGSVYVCTTAQDSKGNCITFKFLTT